MLFLVLNIFNDRFVFRLTNRKCSVTFLPIKLRKSCVFGFYPFWTVALDVADELADVNRFFPKEISKWIWFAVPPDTINFDLLFSTMPWIYPYKSFSMSGVIRSTRFWLKRRRELRFWPMIAAYFVRHLRRRDFVSFVVVGFQRNAFTLRYVVGRRWRLKQIIWFNIFRVFFVFIRG